MMREKMLLFLSTERVTKSALTQSMKKSIKNVLKLALKKEAKMLSAAATWKTGSRIDGSLEKSSQRIPYLFQRSRGCICGKRPTESHVLIGAVILTQSMQKKSFVQGLRNSALM